MSRKIAMTKIISLTHHVCLSPTTGNRIPSVNVFSRDFTCCWLSCPSVRFPFDYNIIKFTIYIFLVSSCFLSFFDLRIPITPLVSSNSSCPIICRHLVIDSMHIVISCRSWLPIIYEFRKFPL